MMGSSSKPILLVLAAGVAGIVCLALAVGAFKEKQKYTPLYEDIMFKVNSMDFKDFGVFSTSPTFRMEFEVLLWNPNPYEVELVPATGGKAYMNEPDNELADAIPTSVKVPMQKEEGAPGVATMTVNITTTKSWLGIGSSLFSVITGFGDVTFFWDYRLSVKASVPIFGGLSSKSLDMPAEAFCGIPADLKSRKFEGAATCGASAEDVAAKSGKRRRLAVTPRRRLEAPPGTPPDDATPLYVTGEGAKSAQSSINMTLLGAGLFSLFAGGALLAAAIGQALRSRKSAPRAEEPKPEPEPPVDLEINDDYDAAVMQQEEAAYQAYRAQGASAPVGRPRATE